MVLEIEISSLQSFKGEVMTDCAAIVARYKHLRRLGIQLNDDMVKTLSREVLDEGAQKIGILKNGLFVFETEDQTSVLMDYCLYNVSRRGLNAVQRYLAETPPPDDSDEMFVLRARATSRYSIFIVQKVIAGVGVELLDIFREDKLLVVDMGFAQTARPGLTLASRVACLGDYWMTGGAGLPIKDASIGKLKSRLKKAIGSAEPDWDNMPADKESVFVAAIVRTCLEGDEAVNMHYADTAELPDERGAMPPLRKAASVGRNDPCPCGSNKKFKKCCGR